MSIKLKEPITIYQVKHDDKSDVYNVMAININTLGEALELGRTAKWTEDEGYVDLYPSKKAAAEEAYNRTYWDEYAEDSEDDEEDFNIEDIKSSDSCVAACCGECTQCAPIPKPSVEELYPLEEYPSKLVRFQNTNTIQLFKRRPGQKPSANCAFITQEEADIFKKDANVKANYSLTKAGKPSLYEEYCEIYFD